MSLGDSDKLCTAGRPPVTPEPSHIRAARLGAAVQQPLPATQRAGHGHSGPRWCRARRGEWDPDVGRCPGCEGWPVTAVEGAPGTGAGKGAVTPRRSDCAGRPGRAGRGRGWCWPLEEGPGTPKARIRPRPGDGVREAGGMVARPAGAPAHSFPRGFRPPPRTLPSVPPAAECVPSPRPECEGPAETLPDPAPPPCSPVRAGDAAWGCQGGPHGDRSPFPDPALPPPRSSGGRVSADAQALRGDGPPFSL